MLRRAGFTLLELLLAVAIVLTLVLIAVPSIHGMMESRRVRAKMDEFDALVTKAQVRAVSERRTMALVWQHNAIALVALDRGTNPNASADEEPQLFSVAEGQEYIIERPAALSDKAPPIWTFWRSGTCEPVIITYRGPDGMWKARYDALNARRTIIEERLQ